ncbi:unnamed protein product [Mytilus coruscus]|uniref:Uncharacterized protein n=1 Tax=Mytilus coruscus TaxID=42192 RepID=A0A6J8ASV6_MYTCO|nr:unnamed protein product [Mytilus coruscus]
MTGNLRQAIQREISIQEASTNGSETNVIPTTSFHAGVGEKNGNYVNKSKSKNYSQSKMCIYCNDQHFPAECKKFTDSKSRMEIVKKRNLCFNCLSNHKISECSHTKEYYDIERFWKSESRGIQENDKLNTEKQNIKQFSPTSITYEDGKSLNSNSNRLRQLADTENVLDSSNEVNILGMRWNVADDKLYLQK